VLPALAHPLSEPFHLPVSPAVAADCAAVLVLAAAFAAPWREATAGRRAGRELRSWAGSLSPAQLATRAAAVALLVLAIAAGRLGVDDELENLAPALVVGAGWPLVVLATAALGPVWRWADPWDAIARALTRSESAQEPGDVWPAAAIALGWVWYLSAYEDPLAPRSVGAILAAYTILTVAGCLAAGRARWLASCEPFGIYLAWLAQLPRGRLVDWDPPRGSLALLGVLAGGVLFGAVRRSELWGDLNTVEAARLVATIGVAAAAAVAAGLLALMASTAERAARPAVARAAVPAVAGIIVAVAMDSNRLFTSVQLLPALLGDPFGEGRDLLGGAGAGLDPAPLGVTGLLIAQLAVLMAGYLAGAVVLARRVRRGARAPVAAGLSVLAGLSVIAVASP
jgi:hypothetical protein